MNIVGAGLDISSTRTGITLGASAPPKCFSWTPPARGEVSVGAIADTYQRWLWQIIDMFNIGIVGFEAPLMSGQGVIMDARTAKILIGLAVCTESVCHAKGVPCESAAVSTIRKHFAGSGRAKKPDVFKRAKLLGWPINNHDEADSAACWSWLMCTHVPGFQLESTTPLYGRSVA